MQLKIIKILKIENNIFNIVSHNHHENNKSFNQEIKKHLNIF